MATNRNVGIHAAHNLDVLELDKLERVVIEAVVSDKLANVEESAQMLQGMSTEKKQIATCWRKVMSCEVPHLSGLGRLMSLRKRIKFSHSFGLNTRPLIELI